MTTFTDLARRARNAHGEDRRLDGRIFKATQHREGDDWSDDWDDEVWHRRDPNDGAAFDAPPHYTGSIDGALEARHPGMLLVDLHERERPDAAGDGWLPCGCTIRCTPAGDGEVGRLFRGQGRTLALAVLDAVLQAHAHLAGED